MRTERFWMDVATVMTLRMSTLPMLWMLRPMEAAAETRQMISEKEDALRALQKQMVLAPMMFYIDSWQGLLQGDSDLGLTRAQKAAERRLCGPYTSRVNANRKRLSTHR